MIRILDIALKDLRQLMRERETFLFLLLMPIIFTLLFGYAFGGFGSGEGDPRLPVGYLDEDGSPISRQLHGLLANSEVLRLDEDSARAPDELERLVSEDDLAAAIIVPAGFGEAALAASPLPLALIADIASSAGSAVQSERLSPRSG